MAEVLAEPRTAQSDLADLVEAIGRGLAPEDAADWPERSAIPQGADTRFVISKFMAWLLSSDEIGLDGLTPVRHRFNLTVLSWLWRRMAQSQSIDPSEWESAFAVARENHQWAAACDTAKQAVWEVARTVANATPREGFGDPAWNEARNRVWRLMADKLVEILAACPTT